MHPSLRIEIVVHHVLGLCACACICREPEPGSLVQVEVIFDDDIEEEALLNQVMGDHDDPIMLEHGPVDGLEVITALQLHHKSHCLHLHSGVCIGHIKLCRSQDLTAGSPEPWRSTW